MAEDGLSTGSMLSSLAVYRSRTRPARIQSALCWLNHWEQPERLRRYKEFDACWRGALAAAERFGYHLDDLRWTPDCSAERFEQILVTRGVRGILIPPHAVPAGLGQLRLGTGFPSSRFGMSVRRQIRIW